MTEPVGVDPALTDPTRGRRVLLAAHGTRSAAGRDCIEQVRAALGERLPVPVVLAWVDVVAPFVADVVRPGDVVLPCFLGDGYHVRHDIPAAVRGVDDVLVTPHLGPAEGVLDALEERVRTAGGPWPLTVLGWAGSSDENSRAEAGSAAQALAARWREARQQGSGEAAVRVELATPREAADLVAGAASGQAGIATYLLAPGHFAARLAGLGVPASEPLGPHPAIVDHLVQLALRAMTPPSGDPVG